jgi:hypothetical protein
VPSAQIQFHADPEEAVSLALQLARRNDLTAVLERFFPEYEAVVVGKGGDHAAKQFVQSGQISRVALCRADPDPGATSAQDFLARNTGCMYLSVGPRQGDAVRESALGGVTDDQDTLRLWRRVVRQAKSEMHKGATIRNPFTGDEERSASHLYTQGAHALAANGVRMLAAAGAIEYLFDDCVG